jgi:hypothetical protein
MMSNYFLSFQIGVSLVYFLYTALRFLLLMIFQLLIIIIIIKGDLSQFEIERNHKGDQYSKVACIAPFINC